VPKLFFTLQANVKFHYLLLFMLLWHLSYL